MFVSKIVNSDSNVFFILIITVFYARKIYEFMNFNKRLIRPIIIGLQAIRIW